MPDSEHQAEQRSTSAADPQRRPVWRRLGFSTLLVVLAWLAREALTPAIGPTALPFITFFPAVAGAAWYGGLRPAIAAVVLSALAAQWSYVEPLHSLRIDDRVAFVAFPVAAAFIVAAIEKMHRARRGLGEAHDVLRTTLASIGDGVIVTDASGQITFLNAEAERLTGWPGPEARGRRLGEVFQAVSESSRRPVDDLAAEVLRKGTVIGLANHTLLIAKDGTETPIDDSAAPVRRPGEPVLGVVVVFRDVREQRSAQAAHARLAAIIESSGDPIISKDLDGRIRSWNVAAERVLGWNAGEIVGRPVTDLIPPELQQEEITILSRLRLGASTELLETTRLAKDGRRLPVSVRISPVRDEDGTVTGASTIIRDLSDLAAARDALASEKDLLSKTLASIGDAVITTDAAGLVTYLNPVAESLTGWRPADAAGRPLTEIFRIINETTRAEVPNPALRAMREGVIVGLANHTVLQARDGAERPIDDSAAPIRDAGGRTTGSVLVFRDVATRRRAERDLQRAEVQSRSVIDHVVDGIISIDSSGTIQSFNRAAERLFGYEAAEVTGRNVKLLMPPPYAAEHDAYLGNYFATGVARIIGIGREVVGLRKDGSVFPLELAVSEFHVGEQRYFTGIVRDVSERKRQEAALREGEARFRVALEGTPVCVFNCDRELRYTWVHNPQPPLDAPGRMLGRRDDEILAPDAVCELLDLKARVLAGGAGDRRVISLRHGTETYYFDCAIEPTHDPDGAVTGVRGALSDITQRRRIDVDRERLRVELAAKVEELQTILDIAPVQIWFGDAECRNITGNRRAYEDHGLTYGINASFDAPVPEIPTALRVEVEGRALEPAEMPMQLAARTGRPVQDFEHDVVRADGRRRTMWANVAPLFDAGGKVRGVIGAYVDVTTLRAAERALREADQRKNEFLATLAHELRNPLAPIRNAIAILQIKGPPDPDLVASRGVIVRQVEILSRLLDDLLDANRLARHRLEIRPEPVSLATIATRALETARPAVERARHNLTVDVPDDVIVDADPVRLAQVFANLLTNAAKYTDPGGRIWFTARREDGQVVLSVKDAGIGIPPEHLPRIFEMFSQVPQTMDRAQGGVGIGLSLARGLVELHGGTISAHSDGPGRGSEFLVRLPLAGKQARGPEPVEVERIPRPVGAIRRILIADDVRDNADTLAMMLGALGHEVFVAYDGAQALAIAGRERPDVALLDIGMPLVDGYEVCRDIRGQPWGRDIRLIAQTGWGQEEDRRRAKEAGFDTHLLKPVDCAALVAILARLPDRRAGSGSAGA